MINVSVKDFGPIIEGTVDLKPLTIFVGPSNAGKSYLATLVYSLTQSMARYGGYVGYDQIIRPGRFAEQRVVLDLDSETERAEEVAKAVSEWARSIEPGRERTLDIAFVDLPAEVRGLLNRIVRRSLESTEEWFNRELQRCHGNISDLRNRRPDATHLEIGFEQSRPPLKLNFEQDQNSLRTLPDRVWDMSHWRFPIPRNALHLLQANVSSRKSRSREGLRVHYYDFLGVLAELVISTLHEEVPNSCYYLPAARSGIAQGHKAIASILVRQSSYAAIRPLEIPTLPGIITDFMGHILTIERTGGRLYGSEIEEVEDVVAFLERDVVRGRIDIDRSGEVPYPEISYAPIVGQPDVGEYPFHRTSSMVSELAPVILFLKYLVYPGDLVVLEEPESHLHPASQRQMARAIVRLVNAGVKVIITTHSDYFVGQINNLLKLSHASSSKLRKEGYAAEDCLKPDDLSAYHFRMDEGLGGSVVDRLEIDPNFGIDEQEFADVSEALYEETVSLQRIRAT